MSSHFLVRSYHPNNGIRRLHLTRMQGQSNEAYFNVTSEVLTEIFGVDVREGDTWALEATLVSRAGTNGKKR